MARGKSNPDYLNGVPELLILKLINHESMYGYQIVQTIKILNNEVFAFGEGSIYPILHRLEKQKLLLSKRQTVNKRSRIVYRITISGKKKLERSTAEWQRVADAINKVLNGGIDEQINFAS